MARDFLAIPGKWIYSYLHKNGRSSCILLGGSSVSVEHTLNVGCDVIPLHYASLKADTIHSFMLLCSVYHLEKAVDGSI